MRLKVLSVAIGLAAMATASPVWSQAKQKVMTITATEPMTTDNPYGESSSPVYSLWCHTYGCLGRYDYTKKQARRHPGGKMGGDRPDHLALYLAQGPEASRRRSRTDIGRCRAHAQAHPHRPGKRAKLVCRHGGGDRADRRPHLRRQDQGAGCQSGGGAVRPLHHHVGGALRQIRPRGRQEACVRLGTLPARSNTRPIAAW